MSASLVGSEMCIRDRYQRRVRGLWTKMFQQTSSFTDMSSKIVEEVPETTHKLAQFAELITTSWDFLQQEETPEKDEEELSLRRRLASGPTFGRFQKAESSLLRFTLPPPLYTP
eukprot:TRINITY_DN11229_c0_g1_i1.p1 TRINITY_DN11229_c0_g1~~TRINITY_DN11229_c0_g1_i1.p1  ORF type:complete len:114 (+),score=47.27 TRINITY_DN11229_c0_g1_i1:2-343(+)